MKILVAGDFVPRHRVASQIEKGDYSCLDEVKPIIHTVDYSIINFESPVVIRDAHPIVKTGPNLKCNEKAMECVAQTGFNCVTLANNHFRDYGQIGVEDTIDSCKKYGIDYVGGGKNKQEAEQILYKTIKEQKLAIVNVCEKEWSIFSDNYGGSAPLNLVKNYYAIREAKDNSNFVLVIVHGGLEGYQYPTPRMQETYRFFIDAGADAVVNHHQHCYNGYEVYHQKPIFYGLGNFCFDTPNPNELWQEGYMIQFNFEQNNVDTSIYPYVQCTKEKPCISLLKGAEQKQIFDKVCSINKVISDKDVLNDCFLKWLEIIGEGRMLNLEPIYNKYIRSLQYKGFIPRQIRGQARLDLYDRLSCETHIEVLRQLLIQEIEKS